MKKPLFALFVMAIVIGCTQPQAPQFKHVWQKINKPEEARHILAKVNTNTLTEGGKAEYDLLKTIVAYQTNKEQVNDSLISASIDYYNQHGGEWLRGRAYFYRGVVRMFRMGQILIDEAFQFFVVVPFRDGFCHFKVSHSINNIAHTEHSYNSAIKICATA